MLRRRRVRSRAHDGCLVVALALLAPATVACFRSAREAPVLRGHVVLGHEVRSFEPCDGEGVLWVVPTEELRSTYDALSQGPYDRVFVELRGELEPAPTTGFGSDYAGQLAVRNVVRAAPASESHGCSEDLAGVVFRAAGNEPFWHVRITRDAIVHSSPGTPDLRLPAAAPRRAERGWIYETGSAGPPPRSLRLALERGRCSDSMVGARYSWRARLELDGETHVGCAWAGDDAPGDSDHARGGADMSGLTGVEWRLVAVQPAEGAAAQPDASHVPTLTFSAEPDGEGSWRMHGSGGCNRFSGRYVATDDGSLSIPGPLAGTMMACPPPIMELETTVLRALQAAESFSIDGDRLEIRFDGGALRYVAAPEA